jgi:hypothetical protein
MSNTLGTPTVPPLPPTPEKAVARWWDAVTDSAQVAGHLAYFAQAWDGAIKFQDQFR